MTWVLLALGALAIGAAGSALTSRHRPAGLAIGLIAALVAGGLCIAGGWSVLSGTGAVSTTVDWPLPLGTLRLTLDGLSAWFLIVIGTVGCATAIYSWGYYGGGKGHGSNRAYAPLLCVMIAAMVLVVCTADVIVFLAGWEMMSLSAFFLVGLHDEDSQARHGAWMYLVATHLGTALGVLPVFGAFIARAGSTQMTEFAGAFGPSETGICVALFALGVAGFGTKAGFMPFHVWLPAAHPVAPSPISALMSGVVIKTGIYGLLRLISWLPDLPPACGIGLIVLSLATGLMAILYALGQRQLKRMLAYSSVENIGIIGLSIGVALLGRSLQYPTLVVFGLGGALLHVLNHSLFKGLLFLSAGTVLHGTGTGDIERLGGLARATATNCFAFVAGAVAICALPPLNGFVSEYLVYNGLLSELRSLPMTYALLLASSAALLALIGAIALAAFSKVFSVVFLGEPRDRTVQVHPTPWSMNAGMLLLFFACVTVVVLAGELGPALSVVLSSAMPGVSMPAKDIAEGLHATASLVPPIAIFLGLTLALLGLRWLMPRETSAGRTTGTWGCGYALPSSSMQYTGSSYGWMLLHSFRPIVRTKRRAPVIGECFPSQKECATETPDLALTRLHQPLFKAMSRLFQGLAPLQYGRIQLYLAYIVLTVLFVFLVEAWGMPGGSTRALNEPAMAPNSGVQSMPDSKGGP